MIRLLLKAFGIGLLVLALGGAGALIWPQVLAGTSMPQGEPAAAAEEPAPMLGAEYEPLRPGTRFTYRDQDGTEFSREVMLPIQIQWFDETARQIVPIYDSRFDLYWFYRNDGGEIQAIGAWNGGQMERWGEYILLLSRAAPKAEPVVTPAGQFADVRIMRDHYGSAWYAKGVGLVKTDTYELISISRHPPRHSPVPGVSPAGTE